MKRVLLILSFISSTLLFSQPKPEHNLKSDSLAKRWDEAMPLGNGWLGALIWQKGNKLRMSLDRVDLWDDRPMPEIDKLKFKWVVEKVKLNQYDSVQKIGDEPYEKYPAPTKIPGAAIEFDLNKLGKIISNELDIKTGLSVIKFDNGVVFNNYIHAVNQVGYFGFENLPTEASAKAGLNNEMIPELMTPNYNSGNAGGKGNSVEGQGLERLGYKQGTIVKTKNSIRYHQPTWNGNYYEVLVQWFSLPGNTIVGQWTISNNKPAVLVKPNFKLKEPTGWPSHVKWWNEYWSRSSVSLPDAVLERQYYLDMYKFGCVARGNTPPISLQAIWTADNGNLPPWKGDFHHDLNTQLSYWPGYASNHLDLTAGYTNWLWKVKEENKRWTKQYFELDGLNVPGVTTISGKPMGGWIQYSMSPTTSAWLAQHFYWQWKYGMDKTFLKERCLLYLDEVESFLMKLRIRDSTESKYKLPLSSSPEYNDNNIKAWFQKYTNYDLALTKLLYEKYVEVLKAVPPRSYKEIFLDSKLYSEFDVNETGLTVAPGQNLEESHRHLSPYMAIHPLGLLNVEVPEQKDIINKSLRWIEKKGTRNWCGYSFSWMACMYARAQEGDNAADMLKKFATNFVSTNSFHLNGDQKGGQYSSFTYRPFTLEGNFAFAQGIHEMLIQSHKGYIEIFPAVPKDWHNISFNNLRTEGAFLVSAKKEFGVPTEVTIKSEAGGDLLVKLPFKTWLVKGVNRNDIKMENGISHIRTVKGQIIIFTNAYE
jgi:alpha-L-fucosidase 2